MAKFILIDHSIVDIGGHYFEYAVHVLEAAEKAGYISILATNCRFKADGRVPWEVHPVYKYGFWFRLAAPSWYRWIQQASSAVKGKMLRLKIWLIFSPLGFFWSIRNQFGEYLRRQPLSARPKVTFFLFLGLGYGFNLACSLRNLLWEALPFRGYLSCLWNRCKDVVKAALYPIFLLIRPEGWMIYSGLDRYRMRHFNRDTRRLFHSVQLEDGDVVFFPTVSEVEMLGLLGAFNRNPDLLRAEWHLLFRRNIYKGREPDYASQDSNLVSLRNAFLELSDNMAGRKMYFYTDTEELTAQYNRLGVARFRTLPIPHTRPPVKCTRSKGQPLRIIYVGDARAEKGYHHLPRIVQDLWVDYVKTGQIVFVFQSYYNTPDGEPTAIVARSQLGCYPRDKVELITEPLSSKEYRDLLSSGDIVLLPYDRDSYYARSSGILAESLAAGIPSLVPAGTWMAKQFVGEIYRHQLSLRQMMEVLSSYHGTELRPRRHLLPKFIPREGAKWLAGGRDSWTYCFLTPPKRATHLLISFKIIENLPGNFVEVYIDQYDLNRHMLAHRSYLVGEGVTWHMCSVLSPLERDACKIRFRFRNALTPSMVVISDIQFDFLAPCEPLQYCPLGAVGLIYSYPDEISDLLREMIGNYAHYRQTAQEFAVKWFERHNAKRLVIELQQHLSERSQGLAFIPDHLLSPNS